MNLFYSVGAEMEVDDDLRSDANIAGTVTETTSKALDSSRRCNCGKCHSIATGIRGRCLFDTPQRYCCGGADFPTTERCHVDTALRCYCGREHTLLGTLFLSFGMIMYCFS